MMSSHVTSFRRALFGSPAAIRKALPGSLLAAGVAAVFLLFFQFTKHDPTISAIMPFGDDPYDAVGSFGVVIAGLLSLLAIMRAVQASTTRRQVLAARTQAAVAAAVLVTLGADAVAMGRHVPTWLGHPSAPELLALMSAMLALALLLWVVARVSVRESSAPTALWWRPMVVCALAVVVLAVYPESLTGSTVGELFTILAGILLLFVPMSVLLDVLVPWRGDAVRSDDAYMPRVRPALQWGLIALLGIGVGVALLVGESLGGDAPAPALRVLVASVYIGGALIGLSIAYCCLRRPLALFRY